MDQEARDLLSWSKEMLEAAQTYYPLNDCTCEDCPECGKSPVECSGTACADGCSCGECDGCRIKALIKAIDGYGIEEPAP